MMCNINLALKIISYLTQVSVETFRKHNKKCESSFIVNNNSRKLFVLGAILLFLTSDIVAQNRYYNRRYLGFYTGINFSGFTGDYQSKIQGDAGQIRLRTQYGIYSNFYIKREFSIFSAIELVLKGSMTKGEEFPNGETISFLAKTNLSTLTFPLLFNYTPSPKWGFMIGPQINYILSAKEPWYKSNFIKPTDYQEDVSYKFNDFTLDAVVAINYLMVQGVIFQVRYTYGLMPIVKNDFGNSRSYSIMLFAGINIFRNNYNTLDGRLELNSFKTEK